MGDETVGQRIRERLLARDYRRANGEPDVQRFAWDWRFDKGHVHAWLNNKMTPFKHIVQLCRALDCSIEWLLTGEEREPGKATPRQGRGKLKSLLLAFAVGAGGILMLPSSRVSAEPHAPALASPLDNVRLIGSRHKYRIRFRRLSRWHRVCVMTVYAIAHRPPYMLPRPWLPVAAA